MKSVIEIRPVERKLYKSHDSDQPNGLDLMSEFELRRERKKYIGLASRENEPTFVVIIADLDAALSRKAQSK